MSLSTFPARFDGKQIVVDAPCDLAPGTPLLVLVLPSEEREREAWYQLSADQLANAFDKMEPEYTLADIRPNR